MARSSQLLIREAGEEPQKRTAPPEPPVNPAHSFHEKRRDAIPLALFARILTQEVQDLRLLQLLYLLRESCNERGVLARRKVVEQRCEVAELGPKEVLRLLDLKAECVYVAKHHAQRSPISGLEVRSQLDEGAVDRCPLDFVFCEDAEVLTVENKEVLLAPAWQLGRGFASLL